MADEKDGTGMPAAGASGAERDAFLQSMGELYDQMMAQAGAQGQTFDDIEELALKLGRQAIQELMSRRMKAEEHKGPRPEVCPECGHRLRQSGNADQRNLETSAGMVRYERRHAFCDRCRKSFSPGGREAEDPDAGRIEPPGQKDM